MKTTIEIPDALFREAKAAAQYRGVSMKEFLAEAVRAELRRKTAVSAKPWMKAFGSLRTPHSENRKVERIIEKEFECIEGEDWR